MIKNTLILAFNLLFVFTNGHTQDLVKVDPYSGSAVIQMPLWNVTTNNLTHPISISFVGDGLKADAPTGRMGSGWQLQAGGFISRSVQGLPDDFEDTLRKGWLIGNVAQGIGNFSPQADDNLMTIEDEITDYNFLNSLGGFDLTNVIKDTQPDIYYINVPGLSGSFLFDHSGQIVIKNDNQWQIIHFTNANNEIVGFTILNENGVEYVFGEPVTGVIKASGDEPNYLKSQYYAFEESSPPVVYNANWQLTRIIAPNGDFINFEYSDYEPVPYYPGTYNVQLGSEKINKDVYEYNANSQDYELTQQYTLEKSMWSPKPIARIISKNEEIEFIHNSIPLRNGNYELRYSILNWINVYDISGSQKDLTQKFIFNYKELHDEDDDVDTYSYIFLKSLTSAGAITQNSPCLFEYYGVDFTQSLVKSIRGTENKDLYGYLTDSTFNASLPPRTYYYPELSDHDKVRYNPIPNYQGEVVELAGSYSTPNIYKMSTGSIKSIKTPKGGEFHIEYEPNEYYDEVAEQNFYGGGLRVKKLIVLDGRGYDNIMEKHYSYLDDNSNSSGRLLSQPGYSLLLNFNRNPQTGNVTYFKDLQSLSTIEGIRNRLIRTTEDINNSAGGNVAYSQFTEKVEGLGKNVKYFNIPITYRTQSYENWEPTLVKIARQVPTNLYQVEVIGDVTGSYKYPFAYNPHYNKQGLLLTEETYNEQNHLLDSVAHEYTSLSSSNSIKGIIMDRYLNPMLVEVSGAWESQNLPYFLYSIYELQYGHSVRRTNTIKKTYEPQSGNYNTVEINYSHNSLNHPYLTESSLTDSENVELKKVYKYPQDYVISANWHNQDDQCKAISKLVEKHQFNTPIEVLTYRTDNSETELIGGTLSKFDYDERHDNVNAIENYAIEYPVTGFNQSSIINDGGSTFVYDPNYKLQVTNKDFDALGRPMSFESSNKNKSGVHYNTNGLPKATINNAAADEVIFSDFESESNYEFSYDENSYVVSDIVNGRVEGNALSMKSGNGNELTASFTNNGDKYVFSAWLKASASGSLSLNLSDGLNAPSTGIISYTGNDKWTYYEELIDIRNLQENVTVNLSTSSDLIIDDLLLRPQSSTVTQNMYGRGLKKIASTIDDNFTSYEYDDMGRLLYVRDKSNNLLKSLTYSDNINFDWDPYITFPADIYTFQNSMFYVNPSELPGAIYKWKIVPADYYNNDFLAAENDTDFSSSTPHSQNSLDYNFNSTGDYFVKVEVEYAGAKHYGYRKVTVLNEPPKVELCSNLLSPIDLCGVEKTESPNCFSSPLSGLALKASVTGGTGNYSYEWNLYYNFLGSDPITVGSNSDSYHNANYLDLPGEYTYECVVTDNATGAFSASAISFKTYHSDQTCASTN